MEKVLSNKLSSFIEVPERFYLCSRMAVRNSNYVFSEILTTANQHKSLLLG